MQVPESLDVVLGQMSLSTEIQGHSNSFFFSMAGKLLPFDASEIFFVTGHQHLGLVKVTEFIRG